MATHRLHDGEMMTEREFLGQIDPALARQETDNTPGTDLHAWWMTEAAKAAEQVIPKAIEYGANSLTELGRAMGLAMGREYTQAEAQEVACFFYLYGKLGRWLDAVVGGYRVGDDTIHDIEIYAKMVKRIRAVGSWPGEDLA